MPLVEADAQSKSGSEDGFSAMWNQIERMPLQQLSETNDFMYIKKVLTLMSRYIFVESDPHLRDPVFTICIARLLKIVGSKCSTEVERLETRVKEAESEAVNLKAAFSAQLETRNTEKEEVYGKSERDAGGKRGSAEELDNRLEEISSLKAANEKLVSEVRSLTRYNDELKQTLYSRHSNKDEMNENYEKAQLEYRHLVSRYKRLADRSLKAEEMIEELRRKDRHKKIEASEELARLTQKVQALQQENYSLIQSRDRAEELCEKREAETLRDMTELRRITKDLLDEERSKAQELRDEFMEMKKESDAHVEQLIHQHETEVQERDEEISILRHQLDRGGERVKGRVLRGSTDSSDSSHSLRSSNSSSPKGRSERVTVQHMTTESQRKLERENDDLHAEIEQLELRIDALDEENRRLTRLIKNYESGSDGLYQLRQELSDASRTCEVLQVENSQLRERLNGMEDSLTFNAALRELCKRVGVTEEEINSLRPLTATAYSEMDTLKEELQLLKEEVEWLEKERRHWMNKVRLQPLMDTKLRFELGLTSEQLKQLDALVDKMKSGALVVEENDESYKEKYFQELQARRHDAAHFSEYVKGRIEDAIKHAFADMDTSDTTSAISSLKEHIGTIMSTTPTVSAAQQQEKAESFTRRLQELELALREQSEESSRLREKLVASVAERETICKERDQYREAIFNRAGVRLPDQYDEAQLLSDSADVELGTVSTAKWLSISNTLREQLQAKDTLIDALGKQAADLKEESARQQKEAEEIERSLERGKQDQIHLQDQIKALSDLHEEARAKCTELTKANKDLQDGLERMDSGVAKELLQKIVLLRRREATLIQRLRRALSSREELTMSEQSTQHQMTQTLQTLREALEDTSSSGFVLTRTSSNYSAESEMLQYLDYSLQSLLRGRLFRDDSRFLLHLRQMYENMEHAEEMTELRLALRRVRQELEQKTVEANELASEAAGLRAAAQTFNDVQNNNNLEYAAASAAKSESEAASYKHKFLLYAKRLEARDKEVADLEGDLDSARQEVVAIKDHIRNILSRTEEPDSSVGAGEKEKVNAKQLLNLEKDVARLKSINLGLLHHSLDLKGSIKSLEIELEAKAQEIELMRTSGDGQVITNFVSAAIREHAALRRQSELALIQAKRLKLQLTATEANYQIVSNEATTYKLGAYRLYRRYVEQIVAMVDYLRCIQRATNGSLSPHRAELLDRRFRAAVKDLSEYFGKNKVLMMQLSDTNNAVVTLEQQLALLQMDDEVSKKDTTMERLREARARVRECDRVMTELREDNHFLEAKLTRSETANRSLNDEVTRLEFGLMAVTPLDEELLATLLQLKETVFDKAMLPSLSVETYAPTRLTSGGVDDGDVAVREYKAAVMRQTELAQQCAQLKKHLEEVAGERRKAVHTAEELKEEIQQTSERAGFLQKQLEEERQKAEVRESRLLKAHETQSDVARRAMEHNVQCLQEMIQKKELTIKSLQEQLSVERRKYTEHELGEAIRMERLHEHMFRENTAMVERFKNAIQGVNTVDVLGGDGGSATAAALLPNSGHGVYAQLQALTTETIRLQTELKEAQASNIILESQLEQQIQQQLPTITPLTETATGLSPPSASSPHPVASDNTDALMGIVRNQTAMLESLRQREMHLSGELQREKDLRLSLEKQVDDLRRQHVEQGGTLQLLSQVSGAPSDAPLISELRMQTAYLEQELTNVKAILVQERSQSKQLHENAAAWKESLTTLQAEVATQQVEVDRVRYLSSLNEGLQADLNTMKDQNDKLVLAASLLKQKLMEEVQRGGESSRQHQQEIALAQRMGTIQQESASHMKALDHRIKMVQKELNDRISKEKEILEKNTESQRLLYQLHQQLRGKEREVLDLQERLRQRSASSSPAPLPQQHTSHSTVPTKPTQELKGTQVIHNRGADLVLPAATSTADQYDNGASAKEHLGAPSSALTAASALDVSLQPQIAGIIYRETQKHQRDNLQLISTLRSNLHRLERDMADMETQLKGERSTTRQLRAQLKSHREEAEKVEVAHAKAMSEMQSQRLAAEGALRRSRLGSRQSPDAEGNAAAQQEEQLLLLLASKEETLAQCRKELNELRGAHSAGLPIGSSGGRVASPADVRQHVQRVQELEGVIDGLRRRLEVESPAQLLALQHQIDGAQSVLRRVIADFAALKGLPASEVEHVYSIPKTEVERTIEQLKVELLEKSKELLDCRFTRETLELQVTRLRRHLDDILAVDAANQTPLPVKFDGTYDDSAGQVVMLKSVIENLKLVIEKLQNENEDLRSARTQSTRHKQQEREIEELQRREQQLQEQMRRLTQRLSGRRSGVATPGTSSDQDLHRRLASARAAAEQYESELNDLRVRLSGDSLHINPPRQSSPGTGPARYSPTMAQSSSAVPPPLPAPPFTLPHSTDSTRSAISSAAAPQRRLSAVRHSPDEGSSEEVPHAWMRHHHVGHS